MIVNKQSNTWGPGTTHGHKNDNINDFCSKSLMHTNTKGSRPKPAKYMKRAESLEQKERRLKKEIWQLGIRLRYLEGRIDRSNQEKIEQEALARGTRPSPPKFAPTISKEQLKRQAYLRKNVRNMMERAKNTGNPKRD